MSANPVAGPVRPPPRRVTPPAAQVQQEDSGRPALFLRGGRPPHLARILPPWHGGIRRGTSMTENVICKYEAIKLIAIVFFWGQIFYIRAFGFQPLNAKLGAFIYVLSSTGK